MGISFSKGLFSGATFVLGRVMSSLPHYTVNLWDVFHQEYQQKYNP